MEYLSRQEEMVLLTVHRLEEDSSLVEIRRHLNDSTDKRWSMSSVYIPLDRLNNTGLLRITVGDPTPKRGGRAKKFYHLTDKGIKELLRVRKVQQTMWDGLRDLSIWTKNE
ncbi:MAG: PadR family transcriptional regulator [bacterium]|nr:PadR family transcriptional regulator [bacterium]